MSHFEPEACVSLWQTDQCAWSVEYIWHRSDYVERGIFLALALMLAYTLYVLIRFLRRCVLARLEFCKSQPESSSEFFATKRVLVADLSRGLWILKAIGTAAPFLGLAGTTYLILDELFRPFSMSRSSVLYYFNIATAASLSSAAAGIVVALPAAAIYNILRTRVETMRREVRVTSSRPITRPFRRAQTLPLKQRFGSLPAFALISVPVLSFTIPVFMIAPSDIATGLEVRLPPIGALHRENNPIVVAVIAKANLDYAVLVNYEETPVDHLEEALAERLRLVSQRRIYVEGDPAVDWGPVADVIDKAKHIHCEVILLTTVPARDPKCAWPAAPAQDSRCRP